MGYGEVPHNDSAFDATSYLKNGKNRLCVMVLKWCSGSYLDDQDKLRLSGVFRDVYLLERSEQGIRDFRLMTTNEGSVQLTVEAPSPVEVQLMDQGKMIGSGIAYDGKIAFSIENLPFGLQKNHICMKSCFLVKVSTSGTDLDSEKCICAFLCVCHPAGESFVRYDLSGTVPDGGMASAGAAGYCQYCYL